MKKFQVWCPVIFPIIGYFYGFFTKNNDIFMFFLGMLIMLAILMVMAWFVDDRK